MKFCFHFNLASQLNGMSRAARFLI